MKMTNTNAKMTDHSQAQEGFYTRGKTEIWSKGLRWQL